MNKDKLVDAIGLLDDKMIADAKTKKAHTPIYKQIIAAVLIIVLIPVVLFGGMSLFGRFMYAGSSGPSTEYEFSILELSSLCRSSFDAMLNSDVGINPNSLNNNLGANAIEIRHANEMRVIFTTQDGIFEFFKFDKDYIESSYSLEKMGLPSFNQGDSTTLIQIDEYGENALLVSSENMSQSGANISYKNLNFVRNEMTDIEKSDALAFDAYELSENRYLNTSKDFVDNTDWLSSKMAVYYDENGKKVESFIRVPKDAEKGYIIGNAELVEVRDDGSYKIYDLFKQIEFEDD